MALWWQDVPETLPGPVQDLLAHKTSRLFFSVASLWEIHIKCALGKLTVREELLDTLLGGSIMILPITARDAAAAAVLPLHHRDLFGRMLVAQSRLEGLTLVTADGKHDAYDVPILDAKPKRRR